jgi:hypothetical protein
MFIVTRVRKARVRPSGARCSGHPEGTNGQHTHIYIQLVFSEHRAPLGRLDLLAAMAINIRPLRGQATP